MTDGAGAGILPTEADVAGHGLHPSQAKRLLAAEVNVEECKRKLDEAKELRKQIRELYRGRVPLGEVLEVAGVKVKRILKASGPSFRLRAYLERHGEVDERMKPFVGGSTTYEDWQVSKL